MPLHYPRGPLDQRVGKRSLQRLQGAIAFTSIHDHIHPDFAGVYHDDVDVDFCEALKKAGEKLALEYDM